MNYRIDTYWYSNTQNTVVNLDEFKQLNPMFKYYQVDDLTIIVTAPFGTFKLRRTYENI